MISTFRKCFWKVESGPYHGDEVIVQQDLFWNSVVASSCFCGSDTNPTGREWMGWLPAQVSWDTFKRQPCGDALERLPSSPCSTNHAMACECPAKLLSAAKPELTWQARSAKPTAPQKGRRPNLQACAKQLSLIPQPHRKEPLTA